MVDTALILDLYDKGMVKFGEFTLKSGMKSCVYLNFREIIAYPSLLKKVSDLIFAQCPKNEIYKLICGVPYSAMAFAAYLSVEHNIPMVIRRKEIKNYGTKQQVEGVFTPGQECLVIEDVVTTATSILETVADLKQLGLSIKHVVALLDREQGGGAILAEQDIMFHPVLRMTDILNVLHAAGKIPVEFHKELGLLK